MKDCSGTGRKSVWNSSALSHLQEPEGSRRKRGSIRCHSAAGECTGEATLQHSAQGEAERANVRSWVPRAVCRGVPLTWPLCPRWAAWHSCPQSAAPLKGNLRRRHRRPPQRSCATTAERVGGSLPSSMSMHGIRGSLAWAGLCASATSQERRPWPSTELPAVQQHRTGIPTMHTPAPLTAAW